MSSEQRYWIGLLFFLAGLTVLIFEGLFMSYGQSAAAMVKYAPQSYRSGHRHPEVIFTSVDGKEITVELMTDFLSFETIEKGDTITVEYLPFWPAYARPQGTAWAFWLTGIACMLIGFKELLGGERGRIDD